MKRRNIVRLLLIVRDLNALLFFINHHSTEFVAVFFFLLHFPSFVLLSQVIPKLLDSYTHPRALVRSITCFTMQHFINTPKLKNVKNPFGRMMKSTLKLISDESLEVGLPPKYVYIPMLIHLFQAYPTFSIPISS